MTSNRALYVVKLILVDKGTKILERSFQNVCETGVFVSPLRMEAGEATGPLVRERLLGPLHRGL